MHVKPLATEINVGSGFIEHRIPVCSIMQNYTFNVRFACKELEIGRKVFETNGMPYGAS